MIYFDHAATCPMRPSALAAMTDALNNIYGNASPTYLPAQQARTALDQARADLAATIGADWKEIFFTSGGTESDNWALIGAAEALDSVPGESGNSEADHSPSDRIVTKSLHGHIITSSIEHHAVLHTCSYLESRGCTVSYLPVDREGFVRPGDLARELSLHPDTFLVSIMMANNEVGTIEPISDLVKVVREAELQRQNTQPGADHGILFHTDAVQAYGKIPINVKNIGVDMLSVSAHKLGGPKGIGFLYLRKGVHIASLLHGGSQESGRRAGTENVPAAIGFAAAAKEAGEQMPQEQSRERQLQDYFHQKLEELFPEKTGTDEASLHSATHCVWNGAQPGPHRLAGNVSISFPGKDQRMLLMNLDLAGICASGGSACTTGSLDPSHVIMAMTGAPDIASGTLRFTLGPENTEAEIDETLRVLGKVLQRI